LFKKVNKKKKKTRAMSRPDGADKKKCLGYFQYSGAAGKDAPKKEKKQHCGGKSNIWTGKKEKKTNLTRAVKALTRRKK